jgi:hypothetical protein
VFKVPFDLSSQNNLPNYLNVYILTNKNVLSLALQNPPWESHKEGNEWNMGSCVFHQALIIMQLLKSRGWGFFGCCCCFVCLFVFGWIICLQSALDYLQKWRSSLKDHLKPWMIKDSRRLLLIFVCGFLYPNIHSILSNIMKSHWLLALLPSFSSWLYNLSERYSAAACGTSRLPTKLPVGQKSSLWQLNRPFLPVPSS